MQLEHKQIQAFNVEFEFHRCFTCGTFWAVEKWKHFRAEIGMVICPNCAIDEVDAREKSIRQLEATISGLKGTITKLSRRIP